MENGKPRRYRLYYWIPELEMWENRLLYGIKVFGYHGLRESFTEAFARVLDIRGNGTIYEIKKVENTKHSCQCRRFRSLGKCILVKCEHASIDHFDGEKCKCKNKPQYIIVVRKGRKFYGIYLCEQHMKILIESARIHMNNAINTIFANMYYELFNEELQLEPSPSRTLSYVYNVRS